MTEARRTILNGCVGAPPSRHSARPWGLRPTLHAVCVKPKPNMGFRTPQRTVPFALSGSSGDFKLMAERQGLSSNSVFETLADWEQQLQHLESAEKHSVGDEFRGPEL